MFKAMVFRASVVLGLGCALALSACFEPSSPESVERRRAAGVSKPVIETVKAKRGTLKNPYSGKANAIADGRRLYLGFGCNGCHGGEGGGGLGPPLGNELFVYGGDDDTLFRLIALGSTGMRENGFTRTGLETVVGPMAPYRDVIDSDQELWKIIAFIRSVYKGPAERRDW